MNSNQASPNIARRRLTRGGLALPVVLASVVSRNAFAEVPYQCTPSGIQSGNTSLFGPHKDSSAVCTLRAGRAELISKLESDGTVFASVFDQEFFANGNNLEANKLSGDSFKVSTKERSENTKKAEKTGKEWQEATAYQVLKIDSFAPGTKPKDLEFARMAIVAYINATDGPSDLYPLTKPQVVAMFKSAVNNRDYDGRTSMGPFTWSPSEVRRYFEHLYH
ncbi:MAG: hypothetical protein ABI212_05205 [Burkholderiaceae bacterium]